MNSTLESLVSYVSTPFPPHALDPHTTLFSQGQLVRVPRPSHILPSGGCKPGSGDGWPVGTLGPEALWAVLIM